MQTQMNPIQQNAVGRMALMSPSNPLAIKRIATLSSVALGSTTRQKLLNVGFTTRVLMHVRAQVDITVLGVQSATSGVYGLVPDVRLIDYNQVERIRSDAASLMAMQSQKRRRVLDSLAEAELDTVAPYPSVATVNPVRYPTAVANNQPLEFWVEVPFCVDVMAGDLRGLSLSQTVQGEQYLQFSTASALVGSDPGAAPYTAGTMTLDSITVDVYQEYYQPQGQIPLPMLDLSTIYEFSGLFSSTSDIATGGTKIVPYPNVRTVLASYHSCVDNATPMTSTQLSTVKMLVNSSQIIRERTFQAQTREAQNRVRSQVPQGSVYIDHRDQPVSTAIYGNVQINFDFATITGGTTYVRSTFESLYQRGTPLPGISTQG
jgi:hypothetical protein